MEQLTSLRSTPGLHTWRPCDTVESAAAWKQAICRREGPTALVFSRQGLPHQERDEQQCADIARGAYVLSDCDGAPDIILLATGSEVALAQDAAVELRQRGRNVRGVSVPCAEGFGEQDAAYREAVLPSDVLARVAVEAAHVDFWYKFVGLDGRVVGMNSFGESAPGGELFEHFGITAANVVEVAEELILGE